MAALSGDSSNVGVPGVLGTNSAGGSGVKGTSNTFQGVTGVSISNAGVAGESTHFHAIYGVSHDPNNAGVIGINDGGGWGVAGRSEKNTGVSGESGQGVGIHGKGGRLAGFFEGNVRVEGETYIKGNLRVGGGGDIFLEGADCAENFAVAEGANLEPGTVLVIGADGTLEESCREYDRRVAGVVSGAGRYRPGIVLDKGESDADRRPIALIGKVYCKVDADAAPVEVGDPLTTSSTPGHAMKAQDPSLAFGALLGKALAKLPSGRGLIPVLVALQ